MEWGNIRVSTYSLHHTPPLYGGHHGRCEERQEITNRVVHQAWPARPLALVLSRLPEQVLGTQCTARKLKGSGWDAPAARVSCCKVASVPHGICRAGLSAQHIRHTDGPLVNWGSLVGSRPTLKARHASIVGENLK